MASTLVAIAFNLLAREPKRKPPGAPRSVRSLLVAMPFAPSSVLVPSSKALVTRSDALVPSSFLLLVVRPGAPNVASDRSVRSTHRGRALLHDAVQFSAGCQRLLHPRARCGRGSGRSRPSVRPGWSVRDDSSPSTIEATIEAIGIHDCYSVYKMSFNPLAKKIGGLLEVAFLESAFKRISSDRAKR